MMDKEDPFKEVADNPKFKEFQDGGFDAIKGNKFVDATISGNMDFRNCAPPGIVVIKSKGTEKAYVFARLKNETD